MSRAAIAVVIPVAAALPSGPVAEATPAPTVVAVHADQPMATVGNDAVGTNDWDSDPHGLDPAGDRALTAAGVRVRELNTGPYDDVYRWRTNTDDADPVTGKLGPDSPIPWQKWVAQTRAMGDQPMIHVNYGSTATDGPGGTDIGPSEAAAWVRQANIVDHDHITYWAIGEEVWGNGYLYQPPTEPDQHADRTPAAYGRNVAAFAKAMKAVDPSIKIGVELIPAGIGSFPDWNDPVLTAAGSAIDFVDVHWYNYKSDRSDAGLFSASRAVPGVLGLLRSQISHDTGANAGHIQVVVGEANSAPVVPGTQSVTTPNALFAADDISTWLENGASDVNWFDTRIAAVADPAGAPDDPSGIGYGDWGLLSAGSDSCVTNTKGATVCEPPVNTPFPAYFGFRLAAGLAQPGARFVRTSGTSGPVVAHAAVRRDGALVVLLENQDPKSAYDVTLEYTGYRPTPTAAALSYGRNGTGITSSWSPSGRVTLAPYGMTELVLTKA